MKTHQIITAIAVTALVIGSLNGCREKEEHDNPVINFTFGGGYTYKDATVTPDTVVKIGVEALGEEGKDPLVKFNISKSVDGGANATVYTEDISTSKYEYDFEVAIDSSASGTKQKYTFTATNRDGLIGQKSITLTVN